ncbi:MAG: hypothetical protein IBJ03_06270 [Gemmatimonadaceae bacterium]|nr:hypothetical protein [Gemmatimonadaceae bacterium]
MMNWILLIMGTIVAVVAALIFGGMLAPKRHRVERGIRLSVPPDEAWPTVRQVDGPPLWCASLPNMRVVEEEEAVRLRLEVLNDDEAVVGLWQVALLPLNEQGNIAADVSTPAVTTLLVITEQTDGGNPVLRLVRSVGTHSMRVDGFLEAVAQQLGLNARAMDVSDTLKYLVSASRAPME